jgi:hypothetical protein
MMPLRIGEIVVVVVVALLVGWLLELLQVRQDEGVVVHVPAEDTVAEETVVDETVVEETVEVSR